MKSVVGQGARLLATAGFAVAVAATAAFAADGTGPLSTLERDQVLEELEIADFTVQDFDLPARPGKPVSVTMNLGGTEFSADLERVSIRTVNFRLFEDDGTGLVEVEDVPPPATYSGPVVLADNVAGVMHATIDENRMWATVHMEGFDAGRSWGIQPLSDAIPNALARRHAVYNTLDNLPVEGICGVDDFATETVTTDLGNGLSAFTADDEVAQIAIEGDWAFWQSNGLVRKANVREVEKIIFNSNPAFQSDVDITYETTYYVFRTSSAAEKYNTNDAGSLLNQFASHWENTKGEVERDLCHLFTGRNLTGSTIGIAATGNVCNSSSYALSQVTFSSNDTNRAGLVSHETGHNWNAPHCDGDSDCWIMCSAFGFCGGIVDQFGSTSQTFIVNFRNSRNCLNQDSDVIFAPVFDDFESASFDTNIWSYNEGANVSTNGNNIPSGIRVMRCNATSSSRFDEDDIRTTHINMNSETSGTVSFFMQTIGTESGEEIKVQYFTQGKNWKKMFKPVSDGVDDTTFTFYSWPMASNAFHNQFRVRFRPAVDETNDQWLVDDFSITTTLPAHYRPYPDRKGGTVRLINAEPGAPVMFYASVRTDKADLSGNGGEWVVALGSRITDDTRVATLELPLPDSLPAMDVTFWAITPGPDGTVRSEEVQASIR